MLHSVTLGVIWNEKKNRARKLQPKSWRVRCFHFTESRTSQGDKPNSQRCLLAGFCLSRACPAIFARKQFCFCSLFSGRRFKFFPCKKASSVYPMLFLLLLFLSRILWIRIFLSYICFIYCKNINIVRSYMNILFRHWIYKFEHTSEVNIRIWMNYEEY